MPVQKTLQKIVIPEPKSTSYVTVCPVSILLVSLYDTMHCLNLLSRWVN